MDTAIQSQAELLTDLRYLELLLDQDDFIVPKKRPKGDITIHRDKRFQNPKLEGLAMRLRGAIVGFHREQQKRLVVRITHYWSARTEQWDEADYLTDHIFDIDAETLLLAAIIIPYLEIAGKHGQREALAKLSKVLDKQVRWRGSTQWIRDNAIKFGREHAELINKVTNKMIRNEIAIAIEQGKDLNYVIDKIEDVTLGRIRDYRAERIARTEMRKAYNQSALEQYKVSGVESFEWFGCNPQCPICAPFINSNPHTADEIQTFDNSTHPNCVGDYAPVPPEGFEPEEV